MTEAYYKLTVSTPFGLFGTVYYGPQYDAKRDVRSAVASDSHLHLALVEMKSEPVEVKKSATYDMSPVKNAYSYSSNQQWLWIKKIAS